MMRTAICSLVGLVIGAGVLLADDKDKKSEKAPGKNALHALFVKADVAKNTITFRITDKTGKTAEVMLALAADAKVLGQDNKPESFAVFVTNMQKQKDKSMLVVEDSGGKHILEIKSLSSKS